MKLIIGSVNRMSYAWQRREPYNIHEVWDLICMDGRTLGSVQIFNNGSACYWFEKNQVGKKGGLSYNGNDGSRAREEAFSIVERAVKIIMPAPIVEELSSDFFYECDSCKEKFSATFEEVNPSSGTFITTGKGPTTITIFNCNKCINK